MPVMRYHAAEFWKVSVYSSKISYFLAYVREVYMQSRQRETSNLKGMICFFFVLEGGKIPLRQLFLVGRQPALEDEYNCPSSSIWVRSTSSRTSGPSPKFPWAKLLSLSVILSGPTRTTPCLKGGKYTACLFFSGYRHTALQTQWLFGNRFESLVVQDIPVGG